MQKRSTPLHIATAEHRSSFVALLLSRGADIDRQDGAGHTALHMAAALGFLDLVQLLVHNGANMSLRNNQGMTALDFAVRYDKQEIAAFFNANNPT